MAKRTCFLLFALFYSGQCHPLGQATFCESQTLPNVGPGAATTVFESGPVLTPSLLNLGYNPLVNSYPLSPLAYNPVIPNAASTIVCDSQPNFGLYGSVPFAPSMGFPGLGYPGLLPGLSTSVCESTSNLVYDPTGLGSFLPRPIPSISVPPAGSTTVCESSPNVVVDPLNMGSFYPRAVAGVGYPGAASTTVSESAPNVNVPGLGGIYAMPLGLPLRSRLPLPLPYPGLVI